MGTSFFGNSECCVLVCDLTDPKSFEAIECCRIEFLNRLNPKDPNNFPFILIGNKCDKVSERKVQESKIKQYCETKSNMLYVETSAKDNTNVETAFEKAAKLAFKRIDKEEEIFVPNRVQLKFNPYKNGNDEEEEEEDEEEEKSIENNENNENKNNEQIKGIKCSLKQHKEINAIKYCCECQIYLCNKCDKNHSELFDNHHVINVDVNINGVFTGLCKEKKHSAKLKYFCKNHNILCCAACTSKTKGKGNGNHKDCNICFINRIKDKKKNELNDNIKYLKDLSTNLENDINEFKKYLKK